MGNMKNYENYILIGIIVLCIGIFIISFIRHKYEMIINFILRMVVGIVGIYFINTILNFKDINDIVGINGYSVLTIGALGTPGFVLLYAIGVYYAITT